MPTPTTPAWAMATIWRPRRARHPARLGAEINLQALAYGERISHNGVQLSLHPAGHVLGSAQVRMEHEGRIWVASGDYKLEPTAPAPRSSRCAATFITESTFGMPIYRWQPQRDIFDEINRGGATTPQKEGPACCSAIPSARRSASCTASMPASGPSSATARWNRSIGCTAKPASACRHLTVGEAEAAKRGKAAPTRAAGDRATLGCRLDLDPPFRRLQRCLRQRLDAPARHAPAARRGSWLHPVRPCGLAGIA
jgi:hypothetical protein